MCCAIAALLIATVAAWRRGLSAARDWRPRARLVAGCAAGIVLAAGSALAAQHLAHYAARADANGRALPAGILAQPICSAGSSGKGAQLGEYPGRTGIE